MTGTLTAEPLTREAFAPFGDVIEAQGEPSFMINGGRCGRYDDLARPRTVDEDGHVSLSVAQSDPAVFPMTLDLMERHPLGSQAFVPIEGARLLVTVAPDAGGKPGEPRAFLSNGKQGIQYKPNTWHGVLAPLSGPSAFLIVDRIGGGGNLEEYIFQTPYTVLT